MANGIGFPGSRDRQLVQYRVDSDKNLLLVVFVRILLEIYV